MHRILFGNVPYLGHVIPTIGIARTLMQMGETVGYVCYPERAISKTLKDAGVPVLEGCGWGDVLAFTTEHLSKSKYTLWWKLYKEKKTAVVKCSVAKLDEGVMEFLELIKNWKPDVCFFDVLFFPGIIAAEIMGVPYACSCTMPVTLPSSNLHPYYLGKSPQSEKLTLQEKIMARLFNFANRVNINELNKIREKYHLPKSDRFIDICSPYLYLAYTTSNVEYERNELPSQVYYIGSAPADAKGNLDDTIPGEWFGKKPVVYFTMGTIYQNRKRFEKVIKSGKGAPWNLIVNIGKRFKPNQFKNVPPNVYLINWISQTSLFPKLDAVISHGGYNTVSEALTYGIPQICLPEEFDQYESSQRLHETGAGIRLDKNIHWKKLQIAINELLSDAKYRQNALRIADDYSKCDAALAGAMLVKRLGETKKPLFRPKGIGPTLYKDDIQKLISLIGV